LEPITVARKPIEKGLTIAENCLKWGTGGINIDGSRVDSNGEHMVKGIVTKQTTVSGDERIGKALGMYGEGASFTPTNSPLGRFPANLIHDGSDEVTELMDSASRFFYCAKASKSERGKNNNHPTVKPTKLMQYLVRLVTPPNGVVLDPFAGSGSTGKACVLEGFNYILIEREAEYIPIIKARIEHVCKQPKQQKLF